MKAQRLIALAVTAALMLLSLGAAEAGGKVTVCHRPPGNPDNVRVIRISTKALPAHLAHGDHLWLSGFCYALETGDLNYSTSEQACIDKYGGHLASIHSLAENNFVGSLVDPTGSCARTARVGGFAQQGFCSGPSAIYAWGDGTAWNFWHWRAATGEPNCSGVPGSVQFWPDTCGTLSGWNDVPVGTPLGQFVCKYRP